MTKLTKLAHSKLLHCFSHCLCRTHNNRCGCCCYLVWLVGWLANYWPAEVYGPLRHWSATRLEENCSSQVGSRKCNWSKRLPSEGNGSSITNSVLAQNKRQIFYRARSLGVSTRCVYQSELREVFFWSNQQTTREQSKVKWSEATLSVRIWCSCICQNENGSWKSIRTYICDPKREDCSLSLSWEACICEPFYQPNCASENLPRSLNTKLCTQNWIHSQPSKLCTVCVLVQTISRKWHSVRRFEILWICKEPTQTGIFRFVCPFVI